MNASKTVGMVCLLVAGLLGNTAVALTMQTVPVGNAGNTGEWSGESYGGFGPNRICGAVGYSYNVGKHEVTAGQYAEFLNAVAKTDTYGLYNTSMDGDYLGCQITRHGTSGNYTYDFSGGTVEAPGSTAADWANRPVNFVSWGDSARFANWMHNNQPTGAQGLATTEDGAYYLNGATTNAQLLAVNREADWKWAITSEDEWYKAAYYDPNYGGQGVAGYYDYPTSSNNAPSNVLGNPTDPGNNATYYNNGYTIGSPYWRTEVGAHENSDSPYGTFDQGGNVWEWNESVLYGSYRGLRGGSFIATGSLVSGLHASARDFNPPPYELSVVGFRVSEVPEPCTMLMLALASVGILRRRA